MDQASEGLMRSALHDLANALSGLQGILELSDPMRPLTPRERGRMEAILAEGMTTLDRARHLAMGSLPEAALEPGEAWRMSLAEALEPLSTIFRCPFEITYTGDPAYDRWPGELGRGYVLALARQLLPYAQGGRMGLGCTADAGEWRILWTPASVLPDSLSADQEARPRDISSRWAIRVGASLGASLSLEAEGLAVRIPRF